MNIIKVSESRQLVRFLDVNGHECEAAIDDDGNLSLDYHVPGSRSVDRTFSREDVLRLARFLETKSIDTPESIAATAAVARQQQQNHE